MKITCSFLFAALLMFGSTAMLTGCNTVEGAGEDLSQSSEYVEGKIDKAAGEDPKK